MRIEDHIGAVRAEGELFAGLLRRAGDSGGLDVTVPSCPEWTVRELTHHLGRVHRWAAGHVRDRRVEMMTPADQERAWGTMPDDPDLVGWFVEGHHQLVEALVAAPADVACWSFLPSPSPLAFWARRQAHETAIHRVDVELAAGVTPAVRAEFALDGLDELLLGFFSRRRNRLRSEQPKTLRIVATDVGASWLVHIGPDGSRAERSDDAQRPGRASLSANANLTGANPANANPANANPANANPSGTGPTGPGPTGMDPTSTDPMDADPTEATLADATLVGPVAGLYLGLWNRVSLPGPGEVLADLASTGDGSVVDLWRTKAHVSWS